MSSSVWASSGFSAFLLPRPRDENQTGAADVLQTVDACTLTAAPLSSALLHFNSSQWHKSTLMHTFVHQQLNGARALQTNVCSSTGSNLWLLKRSRRVEGGESALFQSSSTKNPFILTVQDYIFNIIINSYISNHYVEKLEKKSPTIITLLSKHEE